MNTNKDRKDETKTNAAIRIFIGLALSILSGLMLTAAFAPYNAWPLVFIAFLPLILAQYRVMPAKLTSLAPAVMIATYLYLYFGPSFFKGGIMLALPAIGFVIKPIIVGLSSTAPSAGSGSRSSARSSLALQPGASLTIHCGARPGSSSLYRSSASMA